MREITVDAAVEKIAEVTDFVDEQLDEMGCPVKIQMQINIAVDELLGNIARYAYGRDGGSAAVRVERAENPRAAVITFTDSGIPYNPLLREDPDTSLTAEQRKIGGLGIYIVKKSMDEVMYEFRDGQNVLTIRKNF